MKKIVFICTLVLGLGLTTAWSQPQPGDPSDVPIDGGLSFLIAGGVGYGIYRLKKSKDETLDA